MYTTCQKLRDHLEGIPKGTKAKANRPDSPKYLFRALKKLQRLFQQALVSMLHKGNLLALVSVHTPQGSPQGLCLRAPQGAVFHRLGSKWARDVKGMLSA